VVANTAQTTYVLTAAHVLKGDTSAKVYLPSFRDARLARAVRVDAAHDLALLAFDHADATVVPLAANAGRAQAIAVIGFPQSASAFEGNGDAVRPKLTEGVISSVDDAAGTMVYDAVTDFGNSGGPIVDLAKHQLVGIALGEPSPGNFTGASLSILRTFLSAPLP
jgi:S1-C subfamily serine protease